MPAHITLTYQGKIQLITHKKMERLVVEDNYPIESLVADLFYRYPQLLVQYFPETLHVLINDLIAVGGDFLTEGDIVKFGLLV